MGQCLNRHIPTMKKIKEEVEAWKNHSNNKTSSINWQFMINLTLDLNLKTQKSRDVVDSVSRYS